MNNIINRYVNVHGCTVQYSKICVQDVTIQPVFTIESQKNKPCRIVVLMVLVYGDILTGNQFLTSALIGEKVDIDTPD